MTDRYAVAVSGHLVEGADATQVQARLAQMFRLDANKAAQLTAGKRVVLRKDMDADAARRLAAALKQAGVVPEVLRMPSKSPATPSAPATIDASIAEPGVVLVEHAPVPPPDIDLQGLSVAQPGTPLAENAPTEPADFDLEGLTLAEPGIVLIEPEPKPEPDIDTDALSLEEPQ